MQRLGQDGLSVLFSISIDFDFCPPPPFWGQFSPSEGVSSTIEMLNYRHTVMKIVKHIILVFVTYLFLAILSTPLLDKYTFDSLSLV